MNYSLATRCESYMGWPLAHLPCSGKGYCDPATGLCVCDRYFAQQRVMVLTMRYTVGGMGWAMQPLALVRDDLARRDLVELLPGCSMDTPLYWQHARMASSLIRDLTQVVVTAARDGLVQYD